MRWWVLAVILGGVGALVFAGFLANRRIAWAHGPLPQEAYLWQRHWHRGVVAAVTDQAAALDGLIVLAAEVAWQQGVPGAVQVAWDPAAMQATGGRAGLAIRLGAYAGSFEQDTATRTFLRELATEQVRRAEAAGLEVTELQLDFDATVGQLDDYRVWIADVRAAVAPVPLTLTVLPSWMRYRAFARLIRAADGYVLQVHSLERPATFEAPALLCDPVRAQRWMERAARFGRPFRVALPTYGYDLAFSPEGRYLGLAADGTQPLWPAGTRVRRLEADAPAMAGLMARWQQRRPALCTGILWYRLPVAGDRLNWAWPTLLAVMQGQAPVAALEVALDRPEPGLIEVALINRGSAPAAWDRPIVLRWEEDAAPLADALVPFVLRRPDRRSLRWEPDPAASDQPLPPGARRAVGWLRFTQDMEVQIEP